jgi:hypothetical protein
MHAVAGQACYRLVNDIISRTRAAPYKSLNLVARINSVTLPSRVLTRLVARRIAVNVTKLPELVRKT